MKVPYNYLGEQFAHVDDYFAELRELVQSGEFTLGPYMEAFERKFAAYVGVKHALGVNCGTDALILSLKACGIRAGDEVISVPNTFYATIGAIVAVGARPVFVDVDDRFQIDVNLIERAITARTRAILPVHWTGSSPDMPALMDIARRHNLAVIEDACTAVGAFVGKKHAGSFGKVNAFSMHPLKPLNVWGDGGIAVTDDDDLAVWMRTYRNHGMVDRDHIEMWGVNMRLQPFQAVVARRQLDLINDFVEARRRNAVILDAGLKELGQVVVPPRPKQHREAFQLYIACFQRRDEVVRHLSAGGIEAKVHYPLPLHLQKAAAGLGYRRGDFPNAEKQADEVITLPSHQYLTAEQMEYTVDAIKKFYTSRKRKAA